MSSYLDQNFKTVCKLTETENKTFNLKILNCNDSKDQSLIGMNYKIKY